MDLGRQRTLYQVLTMAVPRDQARGPCRVMTYGQWSIITVSH